MRFCDPHEDMHIYDNVTQSAAYKNKDYVIILMNYVGEDTTNYTHL